MNATLVDAIRALRLSYFELCDDSIRARVVELFVDKRSHDFPRDEEILAVLDHLRASVEP